MAGPLGTYYRRTKAICRLATSVTSYSPDYEVSILLKTNKEEKANAPIGSSGVGYKDCFRGANLRRIEIACLTWAFQTVCGTVSMDFRLTFSRKLVCRWKIALL